MQAREGGVGEEGEGKLAGGNAGRARGKKKEGRGKSIAGRAVSGRRATLLRQGFGGQGGEGRGAKDLAGMRVEQMDDCNDSMTIETEPRMTVVDADRPAGQYRISDTGYRRA